MKKLLYLFVISIFLGAFASCSSSRDVAQRRSLMMPKKSEVPRNAKKYKEREHKYDGD
ncbi:MAG TPA: hypothetical protein VIH57_17015 [Bacteroidales bacterium]